MSRALCTLLAVLCLPAQAALDYRLEPREIAEGTWLLEGSTDNFFLEHGENIVNTARRILAGPGAADFAAVGRLSPRLVPVLRRATAQEAADRPRDGAALLRLLDRSGATATVGAVGWDRLIGAGAR